VTAVTQVANSIVFMVLPRVGEGEEIDAVRAVD
jgi:hypothetical protein